MDPEPTPPAPPRPWVIYALIAANLVAFVIELAGGGGWSGPRGQQMVDLGADYGPLTLHGEWWRLGTSMFLHFGVLHIFFNMACLWKAQVVEAIFDHDGMAAIYLVAGLVGGVASLALHPTAVGAGASGAMFGVYGAFGAFLWLRRAHIPPDLWSKTVRSMGFFLALNLGSGCRCRASTCRPTSAASSPGAPRGRCSWSGAAPAPGVTSARSASPPARSRSRSPACRCSTPRRPGSRCPPTSPACSTTTRIEQQCSTSTTTSRSRPRRASSTTPTPPAGSSAR